SRPRCIARVGTAALGRSGLGWALRAGSAPGGDLHSGSVDLERLGLGLAARVLDLLGNRRGPPTDPTDHQKIGGPSEDGRNGAGPGWRGPAGLRVWRGRAGAAPGRPPPGRGGEPSIFGPLAGPARA